MKGNQMMAAWSSHLPWLNKPTEEPPISSSSYRLLYFWSISCPNCHQLTERLLIDSKRMDVQIIGVHVPYTEEERSVETVSSHAMDKGVTIPMILDQDYEIVQAFGIKGVPSFCLLDTIGNVIYSSMGDVGWGQMVKRVDEIVKYVCD